MISDRKCVARDVSSNFLHRQITQLLLSPLVVE